MYFHAGQDFVLNTRDVIGVFDLDTAGASCRTEEYAFGSAVWQQNKRLSGLILNQLRHCAGGFIISCYYQGYHIFIRSLIWGGPIPESGKDGT